MTYSTEMHRAWRKANPDKVRAKQKRYRARHGKELKMRAAEFYAKYSRPSHLRRKYHLTKEAHAQMLVSQGGVCAICGGVNSTSKALGVDHSHATDAVRGLLCDSCNQGLGRFRDDPTRLRSAAAYLESFV